MSGLDMQKLFSIRPAGGRGPSTNCEVGACTLLMYPLQPCHGLAFIPGHGHAAVVPVSWTNRFRLTAACPATGFSALASCCRFRAGCSCVHLLLCQLRGEWDVGAAGSASALRAR
jgi:hypothetical protein